MCVFGVEPMEGREVKPFTSNLTFQQEGHDTEHAIYLSPGFSLVKVILYVLDTVLVFFFLKQGKKKETRKNKTQNQTKSNVALSSSFFCKVTIATHFLRPYKPYRNQ